MSAFLKNTTNGEACLSLISSMEEQSDIFLKKYKLTLLDFDYLWYAIQVLYKFGKSELFLTDKSAKVLERFGFSIHINENKTGYIVQ